MKRACIGKSWHVQQKTTSIHDPFLKKILAKTYKIPCPSQRQQVLQILKEFGDAAVGFLLLPFLLATSESGHDTSRWVPIIWLIKCEHQRGHIRIGGAKSFDLHLLPFSHSPCPSSSPPQRVLVSTACGKKSLTLLRKPSGGGHQPIEYKHQLSPRLIHKAGVSSGKVPRLRLVTLMDGKVLVTITRAADSIATDGRVTNPA